ncbi:Uncharacterised protein [Lysinibacillus sphaericus]|nr:Uncharacterised protein [Lysinibacillus sphaericus]
MLSQCVRVHLLGLCDRIVQQDAMAFQYPTVLLENDFPDNQKNRIGLRWRDGKEHPEIDKYKCTVFLNHQVLAMRIRMELPSF